MYFGEYITALFLKKECSHLSSSGRYILKTKDRKTFINKELDNTGISVSVWDMSVFAVLLNGRVIHELCLDRADHLKLLEAANENT